MSCIQKKLETLKENLTTLKTKLNKLKVSLTTLKSNLEISDKDNGIRRIAILVDFIQELVTPIGGTPITDTFTLLIHQKCSPILTTRAIWLNFVNKIDRENNVKLVNLFSPSNWDFYEINNNFVLLIPLEYKNKVLKTKVLHSRKVKDAKTSRILTDEEITLGLKINNLTKIANPTDYPGITKAQFLESKMIHRQLSNYIDDSEQKLINCLSDVFLNENDFANSFVSSEVDEFKNKYFNEWNAYLLGHGSEVKKDVFHIMAEKYLKTKVQSEREQILNDFIEKNGGYVAGLSILKFRDLCNFCNDKIRIKTFFIQHALAGESISCYHF